MAVGADSAYDILDSRVLSHITLNCPKGGKTPTLWMHVNIDAFRDLKRVNICSATKDLLLEVSCKNRT